MGKNSQDMKRNDGTVPGRSDIISSNQVHFRGRFTGEIIGNIATRIIWKLKAKTGTIYHQVKFSSHFL